MKKLSKRQEAILTTIIDSVNKRGFPPTVREIADTAGVHSTSTIWYQLQILEARGYIQRLDGAARGIKITDPRENAA